MKKPTPRSGKQQPARPEPANRRKPKSASGQPFYLKHRLLVEFLAIVVVCLLAYGNAIGNGYNLDDGYVVSIDAANPQTAKGISGIWEILTSKYSSGFGVTYSYRPLGKVTMAIEYSLWGNDPQNSHLVNILLFALSSFLLLLLFRRIADWLGYRNEPVIYLALLLFIVHPIHTEVVCSIKNREEILCFGFLLGAVLVFLRYLDAEGWKRRALLLTGFTLLVVLSLLSKQSGFNIFGIVLLILFYRYLLAPAATISWRERLMEPRTRIFAVPVMIIFVCLVIILQQIPAALPSDDLVRLFETDPYGFAPSSHIFPNGVQTLLFYCKKLLLPYPLLFYYGYDMLPDRGWNSIYPYLGILVFCGIAVFLYRSLKRQQWLYIAFWLLYFGITIIPFANIGIFPNITGSIVGERLVYQASAGFCLLMAVGIYILGEWVAKRFGEARRLETNKAFLVVAALFVLPYLLLTWERNPHWKSKKTLYEHDIPWLERSMRANYMMGSSIMNTLTTQQVPMSVRQEMLYQAVHYFQQSLRVYPKSSDGLLSMGKLYGAYLNNIDSAEYFFLKIDTLVPKAYVSAREMLGDIRFMRNDTLAAMQYYRQSFNGYSGNHAAYNKYKDMLFMTRRLAEADSLADIAIANKWPDGYADKGDVRLNRGDTANAVRYYELALRNGWGDEILVRNLRNYYQAKGMTDKLKLLPRQ